jgi:hypothetical protein
VGQTFLYMYVMLLPELTRLRGHVLDRAESTFESAASHRSIRRPTAKQVILGNPSYATIHDPSQREGRHGTAPIHYNTT